MKYSAKEIFQYEFGTQFIENTDFVHDWFLIPLQFSSAIFLSILVLSDPFTYLILKKKFTWKTKNQKLRDSFKKRDSIMARKMSSASKKGGNL
jgi:hypothetical protein